MTQAAYIIRLAPIRPPAKRRESGTYTTTDKAVVEYQKRNGSAASRTLTTLSERSNFTQKSAVSIAEIQVETGLGQRAVEKALAVLESQGFCSRIGKLWAYSNPNADANEKANGCSQTRSLSTPGNIVLDSKKQSLKEVEGIRRKKNNTNTPHPGGARSANVTETDVGAEPAKSETLNSNLTPDGEASDEAQESAPVQTDFKNMLQDGGNVNVTGSEDFPPPAAAPFRAALGVIEAAGLTPVWVQWIKLNRLQQVTQEAQIQIWRGWIDAGLSDVLKTEASDIVESGSFSHPWGGLRARMRKAEAAKATQAQVVAVFGAPRVQPGERRTAPDGQTWTVEIVEYGIVYFEEIGGPTDQPDAAVGRWPLEAARG